MPIFTDISAILLLQANGPAAVRQRCQCLRPSCVSVCLYFSCVQHAFFTDLRAAGCQAQTCGNITFKDNNENRDLFVCVCACDDVGTQRAAQCCAQLEPCRFVLKTNRIEASWLVASLFIARRPDFFFWRASTT